MAKWFYLIDGQERGPVEPTALKQLATTGRLKPTDKVRREDLAEWYEAKQVKGLFAPVPTQAAISPKAATADTAPAKMAGSAPRKANGDDAIAPARSALRTAAAAPLPQAAPKPNVPNKEKSFGTWYCARLGQQPVFLQVIAWWLFGTIWIPL